MPLPNDATVDEIKTEMQNKKTLENTIVLANVIELSVSVVSKIAGKDMADTLNNESLSRAVLTNMVSNQIKEKLLVKGE